MKNKMLKILMFATLLMIVPFISVNAKSESVTDQESLKAALADQEVDTIVLQNNIQTTEKINITREVTIDGNGKTIEYIGTFKGTSEKTTWDGIYILHVYRTTATIKNIKLTGGNAALNVNGSKVTLEGNIDVSGNGFGGIEMSRGSNVTEYPYIDATKATLINTTENKLLPTIWVDGITAEEIIDNNVDVEIDDSAIKGAVMLDENGQFQFYLAKANTPSGEGITDLLEEKTDNTPTQPDVQISENPNTYDGILIYTLISLLGLSSLGYAIKKVATR